jgi:hypothetical protein
MLREIRLDAWPLSVPSGLFAAASARTDRMDGAKRVRTGTVEGDSRNWGARIPT